MVLSYVCSIVALPVYFAARALARNNCAAALAGGGSEEVMCGYARHSARPRDAQNLGLSGLRSLHYRDLQRDAAATTLHGVPAYQPFLSGFVVEYAQNLPTRLKLKPGDVEKRVLRVALEGPLLGVPRSLTRRPKLAAQYGSRFNVSLGKLGKVLGLGARGCHPTPSPRVRLYRLTFPSRGFQMDEWCTAQRRCRPRRRPRGRSCTRRGITAPPRITRHRFSAGTVCAWCRLKSIWVR